MAARPRPFWIVIATGPQQGTLALFEAPAVPMPLLRSVMDRREVGACDPGGRVTARKTMAPTMTA